MAEVRTNPLPPGRYWIDVADKPSGANGVDDFDAWVRANAGKVHFESSSEHPPQGGVPRRLFAIFTVSAPVFFPAANFGFPSFAPASVRTEEDTIQAPPDPADPLSNLSLPTFADIGALLPVLLVAVVLIAASKARNSARAYA